MNKRTIYAQCRQRQNKTIKINLINELIYTTAKSLLKYPEILDRRIKIAQEILKKKTDVVKQIKLLASIKQEIVEYGERSTLTQKQ